MKLDTNWKTPLQLRNRMGGLGNMKGGGADEQQVVGPPHSILRRDRGPLHDGQQISLDALSRDVRAVPALSPRDLVQLVHEDDPRLFGALHRRAGHLIHVHQFLLLLLDQVLQGFRDFHLALAGLATEKTGEHVLDIDVHLLDAAAGDDLERREHPLAHLQLHRAVVELSVPQLRSQLGSGALKLVLSRPLFGRLVRVGAVARLERWKQQIQQALLGILFRFVLYLVDLLLPHHIHGNLDQIANHGLAVPSHVPHLGELGGLHLDEWRAGKPRQAPCDLGLPHAGRANPDEVLGSHFVGHLGRKLQPPHPIAERNVHRPLFRLLADHVLVQLYHDLARRKLIQGLAGAGGFRKKEGHNPFVIALDFRSLRARSDRWYKRRYRRRSASPAPLSEQRSASCAPPEPALRRGRRALPNRWQWSRRPAPWG